MISRTLFLASCVAVALAAFVYGQQQGGTLRVEPVNELCLGCICEAISNCNTTLGCYSDVCGLFKITWAYWSDANKPTLKFDQPDNPQAFSNCVTDPECAARTVTGYMSRFAQDCNNDGVINCYDYAAIHRLGGYGCKGNIGPEFANKFNSCQQQVAQIYGGGSGNAN